MGWNEVDEKVDRYLGKSSICCKELVNRLLLKHLIKEEFPNLENPKIDAAIESCCKSIAASRSREMFVRCLREKLS